MNYLTLGFLALVVVTVVVVFMTLRIGVSATSSVRERLIEVLQRTRLKRMMEKRGIPAEAYVKTADVNLLRDEISACETCKAVERCETVLQSPADEDYGFCPNSDALARAEHQRPDDRPADRSDRTAA